MMKVTTQRLEYKQYDPIMLELSRVARSVAALAPTPAACFRGLSESGNVTTQNYYTWQHYYAHSLHTGLAMTSKTQL